MRRNFFNQSSLEAIRQWPVLLKIAVFLGIIIFILVLGFQLIIRETVQQLSVLEAEEAALKASFISKLEQASPIRGYRHQVTLLNKRLSLLLKQFNTEGEVAALLDEISESAQALGLKCNVFVPQSEVVHDFYRELPVHIVVEGNYKQLMRFLERIAKMKFLITLPELSIQKPLAKADSDTPKGNLIMDIKARVLNLNASALHYDESA